MSAQLKIRMAVAGDLRRLISLYADDILGQGRESLAAEDSAAYEAEFEAIDSDPNHILLVGEIDGEVVATLLLSLLPGIALGGTRRAQIESMRVASDRRGQGLGQELLDHALNIARERGCRLAQLTSNQERTDAHRFYRRAGFTPSHVGFKLPL